MSKELIKNLTEEKNLILVNEEFSTKMNEIMEAKLHEYKKAVSARIFGVLMEQKVVLGRERKALIAKRTEKKGQSTEIDPKKDSGILSSVGKDLKKAKKLTPDQMRAAMDNVASKQADKRHNKNVDKQLAKDTAEYTAKKASKEAAHKEMLANIAHVRGLVAAEKSRKEMETNIASAKKAVARDLAPQEQTKGLLSKIGSKLASKFGKLFKEDEIKELRENALSAAIERLEEAKKIPPSGTGSKLFDNPKPGSHVVVDAKGERTVAIYNKAGKKQAEKHAKGIGGAVKTIPEDEK